MQKFFQWTKNKRYETKKGRSLAVLGKTNENKQFNKETILGYI
jgi:hypothetical protein